MGFKIHIPRIIKGTPHYSFPSYLVLQDKGLEITVQTPASSFEIKFHKSWDNASQKHWEELLSAAFAEAPVHLKVEAKPNYTFTELDQAFAAHFAASQYTKSTVALEAWIDSLPFDDAAYVRCGMKGGWHLPRPFSMEERHVLRLPIPRDIVWLLAENANLPQAPLTQEDMYQATTLVHSLLSFDIDVQKQRVWGADMLAQAGIDLSKIETPFMWASYSGAGPLFICKNTRDALQITEALEAQNITLRACTVDMEGARRL